jgi:bilirubin oxidase
MREGRLYRDNQHSISTIFQTIFQLLTTMLSIVTQATLALFLAAYASAQSNAAPNRFAGEIPKAEALALSQIVEDDPAGASAARKGGSESPAYTLYSAALPIPPLAQVKQ